MICTVCQAQNPDTATSCAACGISLHSGDSPGGSTSGVSLPTGASLPPDATLQNGQHSLQGVLGQGGFGITYRGHDLTLKRAVAIKEFFPFGCSRDGAQVLPAPHVSSGYDAAKARFLEEARSLARFRHAGIVNVYTVFEENNTAYMVMELLQGRTLLQLIEARGVLPEAEAVALITKAGEALAAVHQGGLLHRDLKPENMVLRADGHVVLIDFGTAREFAHDTTLQMTATVTPGYAPLEQYGQQARFGAFTDIYSLGATLYHLLTGQPPVQAPDRASGVELKEPRELNPEVSHAVNDAVLWALEVRVDERPQSVRDFLDRLEGKDFTGPARATAAPLAMTNRDFAEPVPPRSLDLDDPYVDALTSMQLAPEPSAPVQRVQAQGRAWPVQSSQGSGATPSMKSTTEGWWWVIGMIVLFAVPLLFQLGSRPVSAPVTMQPPPNQAAPHDDNGVTRDDLTAVDKVSLASPLPITYIGPDLKKIRLMSIHGPLNDPLSRLLISPDGKTIAAEHVGASHTLLRLWDANTGALKPVAPESVAPESGERFTGGMAFSPDGKKLISCYGTAPTSQRPERTGYLSVLDVQSGRKRTVRTPIGTAGAIALAPSPTSGQRVTLAVQDYKIFSLFDFETLRSLGTWDLMITGDQAASIETYRLGPNLSDDGKVMAVPLSGSDLQMWDLRERNPRKTLTLPSLFSYAWTLSPRGNTLASSFDKQVTLWDTRSGKKIRAIQIASPNPVTALDFSPDGKLLAVATEHAMQIHDARTLALLKVKSIKQRNYMTIGTIAFTSDSKTVIGITVHHPTVYRWRLK